MTGRVLVACEFSGVVRDAFAARGWDAWSCDLLPTERPGQHIQGDVLEIADGRWDLMIAHPPCTYLCSSGLHWNKRIPGREAKTESALAFVMALLNVRIPKIALENPIGRIGTALRKADQVIQPWQFGHPESKGTALWLKGLPLLRATEILSKPKCGYWENQTPSRQNKLGPSPTRAADRARTYPGIAAAMAEQWGELKR